MCLKAKAPEFLVFAVNSLVRPFEFEDGALELCSFGRRGVSDMTKTSRKAIADIDRPLPLWKEDERGGGHGGEMGMS